MIAYRTVLTAGHVGSACRRFLQATDRSTAALRQADGTLALNHFKLVPETRLRSVQVVERSAG